jgi:hypothetical protein
LSLASLLKPPIEIMAQVVVVTDAKASKDWSSGSCVHLSVYDQQCLSYGVVEFLSNKKYTHKNIGYLWAIQQGATKVYDTDGILIDKE